MGRDKPEMIIFAGANGAGKTTAASYLLTRPDFHVHEFVNTDEIARGLSPFNPESQRIEAGRLFLKRINDLIVKGVSFAFETTLSGVTNVQHIERARKTGYLCHLYYFYTDDVAINLARIHGRLDEGGHDVPERDVQRRYWRGLYNLLNIYWPICDSVSIYDITGDSIKDIAHKVADVDMQIYDADAWRKIHDKANGNTQ